MSNLNPNRIYYEHIDGLRALAVLLVFLSHLDFKFFSGGFIGVDIFFVISGFLFTGILITQISSPSGFSFLNFYVRRIKRIFPALFFTLGLSFLAGIVLLNAASFKLFGNTLAFATVSLSNVFFKNQAGYFDIFSQSNPLLHTWSLGVEEQFYIVFPLILFFWHKYYKNNWLDIIFVLFILSFSLNLDYQNSEPVALYYLTPYRIFEFCIGSFIVLLMNYKKTVADGCKELFCVLGILGIVFALLHCNSNSIFPSYNALAPCIGAALIIYAGTAPYSGAIFRCKLAKQLGLISYSLYLIHWPLIIFFKTYNFDNGLKFDLKIQEKIVVIIIAIACSYFMYYFIEQPFRMIRDKKSNSINIIVQGLGTAVIMAGLGVAIGLSQGWNWRLEVPLLEDLSQYHVRNWGGAEFSGEFIHKGKTPYPQIVMMGDSHAGMLDEGLVEEIAKPLDFTVFTASGGGAGKYVSALLIPGLTRLDKNQQLYDDSASHAYKEALKMLHATVENNVLILSAFWSNQLNNAAFLKDHHSLHIDTTSMRSYKSYTPFLKALDNLVEQLKTKKLIIIGDVPGSHYNPINCLGALKWFKRLDCSSMDSRFVNKGALHVNSILKIYASKKTNVYFLNPYDIFCKKKWCKSLDDAGRPYYSDGHHLSKIGSRFFIAHLKDRIISLLSNP